MSDLIKPNYLRVTEILSHLSGLNDVPQEILDKACERGTLVHKLCDALIEGVGTPVYDSKIEGYISSFNKWFQDKKFYPKQQRFYCDRYMITGEVDAIYEKDGNLILVDFKTPVKESKTWKIQLSAYAYLCRLHGINIKALEVVKLSKNGSDPVIFQYEERFQDFIECYLDYFINKKRELF